MKTMTFQLFAGTHRTSTSKYLFKLYFELFSTGVLRLLYERASTFLLEDQ